MQITNIHFGERTRTPLQIKESQERLREKSPELFIDDIIARVVKYHSAKRVYMGQKRFLRRSTKNNQWVHPYDVAAYKKMGYIVLPDPKHHD